MIRQIALAAFCCLPLIVAQGCPAFAAGSTLKQEAVQFTSLTQMAYLACHAEIQKNATQAQFLDREMTVDETTGCSSKAEAQYKPEFLALRKKLAKNQAALAKLKGYYADWLAAIEGGLEDDDSFYGNFGQLRKKAAALEVELE